VLIEQLPTASVSPARGSIVLPKKYFYRLYDGTTTAVSNAMQTDDATLFLAGDVRANESPVLNALHTVFAREHNRKCDEFAAADSDDVGNAAFMRARDWVTALVQSISR
jgi:hypothetical protein